MQAQALEQADRAMRSGAVREVKQRGKDAVYQTTRLASLLACLRTDVTGKGQVELERPYGAEVLELVKQQAGQIAEALRVLQSEIHRAEERRS